MITEVSHCSNCNQPQTNRSGISEESKKDLRAQVNMMYPGVQDLIDVLKAVDDSENSPLGFDMNCWYPIRQASTHPCGTACCIAVWATFCLEGMGREIQLNGIYDFLNYCNLPISEYQNGVEICNPYIEDALDSCVDLDELTREMAIRVLEIFRDTGEVKWTEVYKEMKKPDANVPSVS